MTVEDDPDECDDGDERDDAEAERDDAEAEREEVRDQHREGIDFTKIARMPSLKDESLGGAFKPEDRGQFGDLSRGGRPRGKDRGWAAEPKPKRPDGFRTLPVSRNIKEGKPLGKIARRQVIRKSDPQSGLLYSSKRFTRFIRVNGRRVFVDFSDRYDGYDRKIHDSRFTSLRDESYSSNKFGDDSGDSNNDWNEHSLSAMDDRHREDSSSPRSLRQRAPDGNVWRRTGRRGRQSYPYPVDCDDHRPKTREPDWPEIERLLKPVWKMVDDILRKDEHYAFVQRYQLGMSYESIAETSRPKLSGRAQAYKLVERARKKLEARIGKRIPNPFIKTSQ